MYFSFYLQWDVGSLPSVGRWYVLSSVVRRYISFIVSGTSMNHLFSISSVVRWYISFMPSVERWYVLSSVVRRYISFIVSGTSMNYISFYIISGTVVYLFHAFSGT